MLIDLYAKRKTTNEERAELTQLYGERDGGYTSIRCDFSDPNFTAIFVQAADEKESTDKDTAFEALQEVMDSESDETVSNINRILLKDGDFRGKSYPRRANYSKVGRILSHGYVFTSGGFGRQVDIAR